MTVTYGDPRKIPINDNVDLLVRSVSITENENSEPVEAIEFREHLKNADVEGHGVFVPKHALPSLLGAIQDLL